MYPTNTIDYIVLYCNYEPIIILFTQLRHKKQAKNKKLISKCNALKSTVIQYNRWHTGTGIK